MGTSAFMGTDLQFRARIGAAIPEGVALGPNGHPTTDANAARRTAAVRRAGGRLQEVWPCLGDGRDWRPGRWHTATDDVSGYLFIAFKPNLFSSAEDYRSEITRRIDMIKASPRQMGVEEIRILGERSYRTRVRLLREGIEIDRKIHTALGRLAMGELDHGG